MPQHDVEQGPGAELAERTGHDDRLAPGGGDQLPQILLQDLRALGVVRRVEDQRPPAQGGPLPAARPVHVLQAAGDVRIRRWSVTSGHAMNAPGGRVPPLGVGNSVPKHPRHQRGGGGIPALVVAGQVGRGVARDGLPEVFTDGMDRRPAFRGNRAHDAFRPRWQAAHHHRPAGLDDTGLLAGDLLDGAAQLRAMVESDGSDDRDLGLHDVGGVQPAAEADLDDREVGAPPLELQERHRGHELEKRRVLVRAVRGNPCRHGLELGGVGRDFRLGEQPPVDLHPFAELHQVRRSVEPGVPTGGVEDRVEHGRDRPLAVRARDMQHRITSLRVPQRFRQPPHAVDPELHPARLERVEVVGHRRVVGKGFNHGCHG